MKTSLVSGWAVLAAVSLVPASLAQAPRDTATGNLGFAEVSIEYGQPAWNADRLDQMEQGIPVGQVWRAGADDLTSITIKGAPVFLGNTLLDEGKYGLNIMRLAEKDWCFLVYEDFDASDNWYQGIRPAHNIDGKLAFDHSPESEQLQFTFTKASGGMQMAMSFGPIYLTAAVDDVNAVESEVAINGIAAEASAYKRPADTDLSRPAIAGTLSFEVDGDDCNMKYFVSVADGQATVTFLNADRMECEGTMNRCHEAIERLNAFAAGQPQVASIISDLERRKMKAEIILEDYASLPHNLSFSAPVEDVGQRANLMAQISSQAGKMSVTLRAGTLKAIIPVDASAFTASGN